MRLEWKVVAAATIALSLSAHVVWIEGANPRLEVGKKTLIRIGNGHNIAGSDSAIPADNVKMWAVTPANTKLELKPATSGPWLASEYLVPASGAYRFVMTQDRGVVSATPAGYKPGGRDVNRNAVRSMKIWRSASSVGLTPGAQMGRLKPLGLVFELVGERRGDTMDLVVMRQGKPHPGADLAIGFPGKTEQDKIGTTDATGRFTYKVPASSKGPLVFVASISEPAGKTATFDTYNYSSSLYLVW